MTLTALLSVLVLADVGAAPATAAGEKAREAALGACVAQCESLPAGKARAECEYSCERQDLEQTCDEPASLSSEALVNAKAIQAEAAAACHPITTCPDPKSCASWSTWYDCGSPTCGPVRGCGEDCPDPDPRFCFGPGLRQPLERFRVCVTPQGQCTEYQRTRVVIGCGC